jgi:hypothetical protein
MGIKMTPITVARVAGGCGEPCRHAWVGRVSRDVHMDLTTSTPEVTVRATTIHGSPCVAEMVEHVPEQDRKVRTVKPVTTEPSVGPEGGVGVVVHLSKTSKK